MKRVLYIGLLLLVGLLTLEGCIKEDNPVVAETRNISMTMNVDTRAGGSDINVDIESAINTLRVYAFYGERKVGYFYGNDKNLVVDGGKLSFSMDLDIPTMSFLEEPISFYLVANEETVSVYNSPAWSPDMTRMQLENYCFRELNNPRTALPMVTVKDVMINPNDIKESEVHSEHWMWTGGPIEFKLERSVAKLGMYFAAKEPDADLEVIQVEILPSGLQDYSYMFAPGHESENLKNVPHSWQYGFSLINGGAVSIDKVVTDDEYNSYTPEDKKNPEKISAAFTDVLSAPAYMFENYYGSNNPNQQGANDTDGKGYVLKVTYSVAGSQSEKLIYLPDIERNACYYVLNRIGVDGIVSIVYNVADWENGGDYTVEWGHPTHSFTASASEVGDDYCKINYDIDHDRSSNRNNNRFLICQPKGYFFGFPFAHITPPHTLIYLVARPDPIRFTEPVLTMAPRTASTVVGLTSGRILQISALESGVRLFRTVASTRAFFVIFLPCTTANRLSSSL